MNTNTELAQQRLDVVKEEADSLATMKNDLIMQGGSREIVEGPGTVSIFLSKNLIDSALKGIVGVTLPVPNVKGATLTIKSVTADLRLGFPLVTLDAVATKQNTGLTLQTVGTGRLEANIDPANPSQFAVNIRIEELVPKANWGFFDLRKKGFAQDLMKAGDAEEPGNIGSIQIPIVTDFPLSVPAFQSSASFPGAQAVVSAPALKVTGHVTISRVLALPDGLHIFGSVSAKAGS